MALDAQGRGDLVLAEQRADKARTWTLWSFWLGLAAVVLAVCAAACGARPSGS